MQDTQLVQVSASTDVSVVPAAAEEEVTLLVSLLAPAAEQPQRGPVSLIVVLDRSGSMAGGRLASAQRSLTSLVDRLSPTDTLGLVTFDNEIDVVVPAAPLTNKAEVKRRIAGVTPRGSTNLSGGLVRGLAEARRTDTSGPTTVLLLSDGKANVGATDAATLTALAARGRTDSITTSTLGVGLGYDETLLEAIAGGGTGNHCFAETPDDAAEAFATEIGGLLDAVALGTTVTLRPGALITEVRLLNQLPCATLDEGLRVEVGDLYTEEQRRLVFRAHVQAPDSLGRSRLAQIGTAWLDVSRQGAPVDSTLVVSVDIVDAATAQDREVDQEIRGEADLLEAHRLRRDAADALSHGDFDSADQSLRRAMALADEISPAVPDLLAAELDADRALNEQYLGQMHGDARRVAKDARASAYRGSAKRGRQPRRDRSWKSEPSA